MLPVLIWVLLQPFTENPAVASNSSHHVPKWSMASTVNSIWARLVAISTSSVLFLVF